ncbi:MAG: mannose-phosphate guanylyltransferase [Verrucomicrobiota bacterium]|jgi:NDP-sugar pyrophosphorylase family protein
MKAITRAFVLGAGLGTRLRPLTDELPKPLIPIFQKPLITFAIDHLLSAGVESFVVNTHRLPNLFEDLFAGGKYSGHSVTLVHEPDLLETGGGIKNAEPYLSDEHFITYSGDILTDADLRPLIEEHIGRGNDVTLAVRQTGVAASVALKDGRIVDIGGKYGVAGTHDFANIAVWSQKIFQRIPPAKKVSFVPTLAEWIGENGKIGGVVLDDGKWFNIGSRAEYLEVHRSISKENWNPRYSKTPGWPQPISKTAHVDPTAKILGCSAVGPDCQVAEHVILEDTILWPGSQIASRSHLCRCIVRSHRHAAGIHHDVDI